MKKEKCYISGKISGINFLEANQNFKFAQYHIESDYNLTTLNPFCIKPFLGLKIWICYMIADIWQQRKCTHTAFQKNWLDSKGAVIEYFFAKFVFKHKIIWL